jgi:hypothetical protein
MSAAKRAPNRIKWWLFIISLAAITVIGVFIQTSHLATSDPNEVLRHTISRAMENNISKFSCAHLVWRSERKGFGPWSNRPGSTGTHQLWWNKKKIAISSETITTIQDPNGQVSSNQEALFMTYDGRTYQIAELPVGLTGQVEMVISKKPRSSWYENNYLQSVGWKGSGGLNDLSRPTETGVETWSTEDTEDGSSLIRSEFRNEMEQVGVKYYDEAKGGMLVSGEQYYDEQIQIRQSVRYKKISGDAWFPISVLTEQYNIQNGELILRFTMEIDTNKSIFNNPSSIPDDIFEIEIGPNTEVIDLTSLKTKLKMELNDF